VSGCIRDKVERSIDRIQHVSKLDVFEILGLDPTVSPPVVKPRFANLAKISANPPNTTPHSVRMHSGQGGEVHRPNTSCFKIGRF